MDHFNRRDFLKKSAATIAAASFSEAFYAGCASAPGRDLPAIDSATPLLITRCSVVDVAGGRTLPERTITIAQGKIQSIEPYRPEHDGKHTSINAGGSYVIPGLIDAHCHLTLQSCGFFKATHAMKYLSQIKRNGMMQIDAGVTMVRDMGSFPKLLHNLLDDFKSGSLIGPQVKYCNAFTNIDGGHPDIRPTDLSAFAPVTESITGQIYSYYRNRGELMEKLRKNVENGASFIKLTMDDKSLICGKGKIPVYDDEDLKAIFDFAESKGLPVAVHSIMYYGLRRALKYPVHSMEHITGDAVVSDADIQTMARKKVSIIPTLLIGPTFAFRERYETLPRAFATAVIESELKIRDEYLAGGAPRGFDPDLHALNLESIKWFKDPGCAGMPKEGKFLTDPEIGFNYMLNAPVNIRKMRNAGVRIGCGTDSGVPFHYHGALWREMELMSRVGFRNDEILRFATLNNAAIIGAEDAVGSLKEGKCGDLVVLKDNPLQKIGAVRSPLLVIAGGTIKYSAAALKKDMKLEGKNSYAI
jgi:imidazolonepropionase-like amidohydrolase